MKLKLFALMLLAGGSMFAQSRFSVGVGFGAPGYYPRQSAVVVAGRPPYPGPGYEWVEGYYAPNGGWVAGYWAAPQSYYDPQYNYAPQDNYAPQYYAPAGGYYGGAYYRGRDGTTTEVTIGDAATSGASTKNMNGTNMKADGGGNITCVSPSKGHLAQPVPCSIADGACWIVSMV